MTPGWLTLKITRGLSIICVEFFVIIITIITIIIIFATKDNGSLHED